MAVTTANTLKLSDVCLEIYGSSSTVGRTLATCHTDATGTFNPTYAVAGANTLLDFRGYVHATTIYTMYTSPKGFVVLGDACFISCSQARYYDGANPNIIQVGDFVYTDAAGTLPFNGGSRWYGQDTTSGAFSDIVCQIAVDGECIGASFCVLE